MTASPKKRTGCSAALFIFFVFLALSGSPLPSVFAAPQGTPGAPPRTAKCPVCGMLVAKYPDWLATVVYRDGTTAYFDGPKDLFTYYLNRAKYDPARMRQEIAVVTVKDYYTLATIDARKAYFVTGSDVLGPMGKELVPFAKREDAENFRSDHQGHRTFHFSEITADLVRSLR